MGGYITHSCSRRFFCFLWNHLPIHKYQYKLHHWINTCIVNIIQECLSVITFLMKHKFSIFQNVILWQSFLYGVFFSSDLTKSHGEPLISLASWLFYQSTWHFFFNQCHWYQYTDRALVVCYINFIFSIH